MTEEQRIIQQERLDELTEIEDRLYQYLYDYCINYKCTLWTAWDILYTHEQELQSGIEK